MGREFSHRCGDITFRRLHSVTGKSGGKKGLLGNEGRAGGVITCTRVATKKNETQLSLTFRAEDRFTYWWSPTSIFSFASRLPSLRHPKPNYRNRMCICIKPLYASFQGSCGPRSIESLDTVSLNPYAMALPDTIFECHNPPNIFTTK